MRPSSFAPKSQSHSDGKILREEKFSVAGVCLGRDLEDRAKTTSVECTKHVTFGVLPNVNITKHNRDANLVKSASSGTKR